jgi:hypothetical protein
MNDTHDAMRDDVAAYALGTASDAQTVRQHLRSCAACRAEYESLTGTVTAVAASAQAEPSDLLKARIMRAVRSSSADPKPIRATRPIVWPAYLVAAACFALAVALSLMNLSLIEQLKTAQLQAARTQARSSGLVRDLTSERSTIADLMDESAQRLDIPGGQIVRVHDRLYITMHDLAQPPRGKVYQAWTLPKGGKSMQPSLTFLPDAHGVAVVAIPVAAKDTAALAISVEPEGGSKAPTTKPLVVEQLD